MILGMPVATQAEAPFVISQGVVLLAFLIAGALAVRSFHPTESAAALRPT